MFFARRRHRHSLLELILLLFGIKLVCCKHKETSPEDREAHRAKAKLFRDKLKEAFSVWRPEEAPKAAAPEAGPAENS